MEAIRPSDSYKPVSGLSLVIVHAGYSGVEHGDVDEVCARPIQSLIDSKIFEKTYEHVSYGSSFVSHMGIKISNDQRPGAYESENIEGNEFVIVGGGLGYCHLKATSALIRQRAKDRSPTPIHVPLDCTYKNEQGYEGGDHFLASFLSGPDSREIASYLSEIIPLQLRYAIVNNELIGDSKRDVSITIWDRSSDMLEAIIEREISKEKNNGGI